MSVTFRSSCVHIISECIDSKRIPSTVLSASTICDLISTNDTQKCIDINTFLDDNNKLTSITDPLLNVCNPNPCATKRPQICVVNNNCNTDNCVPFRCLPACKLGMSYQLLSSIKSQNCSHISQFSRLLSYTRHIVQLIKQLLCRVK